LVAVRLRELAESVANLWVASDQPGRMEFVTSILRACEILPHPPSPHHEAKPLKGGEEKFLAVCEFLYGGPYISAKNLRLKLSEEILVYPHSISQSLGHESLSEALASESAGCDTSGWSVEKALGILKSVYTHDSISLCYKMDELEALLFWNAACSSAPTPMSKHSFLCSLAWCLGLRDRLTHEDIYGAYATTPFLEVLLRLLNEPESIPLLTPRAECAMRGGHYQPWGKSRLPEGAYLDVMRGPRRFLHIHERKATLRGRDGKHVVGLKTMWDGHRPRGNWIIEVESLGNRLWCATDCLFHNEPIIDLPYEERLAHLEAWAKDEKRLDVIVPMLLTGHETVADISGMLEGSNMARIVDGGAYKPGSDCGWIVVHHAFQFRLLVTDVKRNDDGYVELRLAALDGHDTYPVHTVTLDTEKSSSVLLALNRRGFTPEEDWEDVQGLGIIMEGSCTDIAPGTYHFLNYEPLGINSELGRGDASQYTDIIEAAS
jgi:hypothetical protein